MKYRLIGFLIGLFIYVCVWITLPFTLGVCIFSFLWSYCSYITGLLLIGVFFPVIGYFWGAIIGDKKKKAIAANTVSAVSNSSSGPQIFTK